MTKASPDPDGPAPVLTPEARRVLVRTPGQCLRHGLIQSLPFLLVLVPFGLLFGVVSDAAGLAYPIRDGVPVMLVEEARRLP